MKIMIKSNESQSTYDLPDSFDLMFGDSEGLSETRFEAIGRINNLGNIDNTLQRIRDDYDGARSLSFSLCVNETPVYTQKFNRLVYTFSSASDEFGFVESLYFAS